jgi:hypothetical protein
LEKIMSTSNDTSRPTTLEDHRPLADSELDAVSGGWSLSGIPGAQPSVPQSPHPTGYLKMSDIQLKRP